MLIFWNSIVSTWILHFRGTWQMTRRSRNTCKWVVQVLDLTRVNWRHFSLANSEMSVWPLKTFFDGCENLEMPKNSRNYPSKNRSVYW